MISDLSAAGDVITVLCICDSTRWRGGAGGWPGPSGVAPSLELVVLRVLLVLVLLGVAAADNVDELDVEREVGLGRDAASEAAVACGSAVGSASQLGCHVCAAPRPLSSPDPARRPSLVPRQDQTRATIAQSPSPGADRSGRPRTFRRGRAATGAVQGQTKGDSP